MPLRAGLADVGYNATLFESGRIVWRCAHVHPGGAEGRREAVACALAELHRRKDERTHP